MNQLFFFKPKKSENRTRSIIVSPLFLIGIFLFVEIATASVQTQWGGHIKVMGQASWPGDESYYNDKAVKTGAFYDGFSGFRLKNKLFIGSIAYLETDYQAALSGGDARKTESRLARQHPEIFKDLLSTKTPGDDARFFNLTNIIKETDEYILYHRLDRLSLTLLHDWGNIRLGRQALTWGNGFLFNPIDLFNPFSPIDIDRDYKIGDDMATIEVQGTSIGDLQFLYVPRRDPETGDIEWKESSIAGKLHTNFNETEFDFMLARHYKDDVAGVGTSGYIKDAAWRFDVTWTFLHDNKGEKDNFFSAVLNLDYSWISWEKNFYGLLEFFYNGPGQDDYSDSAGFEIDPELNQRIKRGELFTIGKYYIGAKIQMEIHPLVNIHMTTINNLEDYSGMLQPVVIWDAANDFQIMAGINYYYGSLGSEYGGLKIPGTNMHDSPPHSMFLWMARFF